MLFSALINEIDERLHNIPALYIIFGCILDDSRPDVAMWKKKIAFIISLTINYSFWMNVLNEIQKENEK